MFYNTFFKKNPTACEIMLKNIVDPDRPHMAVWCMCIVCWIPKGTNTHPKYVILLLFHCQSGHANVPQYCVVRAFYVMRVWNLFCFNIRTQSEDVEEWVLSDSLVSSSWEVTADWEKIA